MNNFRNTYATSADFCRVFESEMDRLYLLAFLLLADHASAEQCFLHVLEAVREDKAVFKPSVSRWIRHRLIQDALQRVFEESSSEHVRDFWYEESNVAPYIDAIVQMDALERFGFVLVVLEGYSTKECSLLLGSHIKEVTDATLHALGAVGTQMNDVRVIGQSLKASA